MQLPEIELHYGAEQPLRLPFDGDRFRSFHAGPPGRENVTDIVRRALTEPSNFPPLSAMCVPGDQAVLVLDRALPCAGTILAEVIQTCCVAGVDPTRLTILQPAHWRRRNLLDPRSELPEAMRTAVQWKIHDPTAKDSTGYLAASISGERIYLARELLDADFVIPLFTAGFDTVLGYRSPGSLLYPGLSNPEAFAKSLGEGHRELRPEDDRPLRQLGDEICWMLGILFAIGAAPGRQPGSLSAVWAGQWEAVQRQSRQFVDHAWRVPLERRAEMVVLSISGPVDRVGWEEVGAALAVAQNLVVRDGRILILSSLAAQPGPGLDMLRSSRSPKAALQLLRRGSPPDLVSSAQAASAAAWAKVSLLSRLETSLVEDLHLTPVASLAEAERLISLSDDIVLIDGGEHVWGEIVDE